MLTVAADEDSVLAMIRAGGTEATELAFSGEKRQRAGVTTHAIQAGSDLSTQLSAVFDPVVDFHLVCRSWRRCRRTVQLQSCCHGAARI